MLSSQISALTSLCSRVGKQRLSAEAFSAGRKPSSWVSYKEPSGNIMEIEPVINETGQSGAEKEISLMAAVTSPHSPLKQIRPSVPEDRDHAAQSHVNRGAQCSTWAECVLGDTLEMSSVGAREKKSRAGWGDGSLSKILAVQSGFVN